MKEFTKVSIHNHFGNKSADRLIDGIYNSPLIFDYNHAINLLKSAKANKFELLALTQSNNLPAADYCLLKFIAKKMGIEILPGVEFNLKNKDDNFLHTVVVFDPKNNIIQLEEIIQNNINSNQGNYITIDQFIDLVIDHKCIIAAHGIKQSKEGKSATNNPETFSELIDMSDSIPVIIEGNKSYHKVTLRNKLENILESTELKWIDKTAMVSAADRKDFSEIESPTYIWGNANFNDLYYACFMGKTRIKRESDIINKINYISKIEFVGENEQIAANIINCSHGLNTIIGPSGSGKTLLLDIIKRKLTNDGIENKSISNNCDYSKIYNCNNVILYDGEDNVIDSTSGYAIIEGEILYNKVISAYQFDKQKLLKELKLEIETTELNLFIDDYNEKINSYIVKRRNIIDNQKIISDCINSADNSYKFLKANVETKKESISYVKNKEIENKIKTINTYINGIEQDLMDLDKIFAKLESYSEKYMLSKQYESDLINVKIKLINSIELKHLHLKNKIKVLEKKVLIQSMIYDLAQKYNSVIGKQYRIIVERRQELIDSLKMIEEKLFENIMLNKELHIPTITKEQIKSKIKFNAKGNAKLTITNIKLEIDKEDFKVCFANNIGGKSPKLKMSDFKMKSLDLTNSLSVKEFADVFINVNYKGNIQLNYEIENLVEYKIELKNIEGHYENIDMISAGNLSKIYINRMFEEKISSASSNAIILYDQPDSNMEKVFILNDLVPKISDLRDKYQVFITTHEPLLVVNSDSNAIIVASNDKTAIKSNDIRYTNKSFVGINSKAEMILEVAKLIDGHPDAIKTRSTIYGGVLHEN